MSDVAIVSATIGDFGALRSLITAYHAWEVIPDPPNLDEAIMALMAPEHPGGFWLAMRGDQPLAYIAVTPRFSLAAGGDVLVIDEIFVTEDARSLGLGRRLINAVHAYGAAIGCRQLLLEVANGNRTAQAFYAVLGFTPRLRRCWERPIEVTPVRSMTVAFGPNPS